MTYKIPLFKLNYDEQEENAVLETLRSKWISTGPKCMEFENKFAGMLGVKHAVALSNCTSALHLALLILGIEKDDEVICPSLTFVATVNAIRYVNAKPVFCDIQSIEEPIIDTKEIKKLITKNTKAIMVMHYAGFPCNMQEIMQITKDNNLIIIEDACHGPLSEYEGKKLGTIGDIGCFSFFSNKNISTGEGGMLVTNNSEYFEKAKLLRSHGMTSMSYQRASGHSTSYDVTELGYNYRMDDLRASLGLVQLSKLAEDYEKRNQVREWYLNKLSYLKNIEIPFKNYRGYYSNYIFPIVLLNSNFAKRDKLREELAKEGIQTSIHYPAVHRFEIYNDNKLCLNNTEYYTDNSITLPMYSNLNESDIDFIMQSIFKGM